MTIRNREYVANLAEKEEEQEGPIGVILAANVIVETDDHDIATNVAEGVVNELNEAIECEGISVDISQTYDHFYPEEQ